MSRIAAAFAAARDRGRAAFVPYLTVGDPSPEGTVRFARALVAAGADVLELGVPFSDPIADGPVLQRSAQRALRAGVRLRDVFEVARRIREESDVALLLFSYLNPLLRVGAGVAARAAKRAGIDGVLVTDMPPEEAEPLRRVFRAALLDTVFLVAPTSPPARMRRAARMSTGFLYVVSRAGTTGARRGLPAGLAPTIRRARRAAGGLPVAVGFGIASPAAAAAAARLADGVVVGSALVAAAERARGDPVAAMARLARSLSSACRKVGR